MNGLGWRPRRPSVRDRGRGPPVGIPMGVGRSGSPGRAARWLQLPSGCTLGPGDILPGQGRRRSSHLRGAGSFVFGKPGLSYRGPCPTVDSGFEVPAPLPVEATPALPPAFPCDQAAA